MTASGAGRIGIFGHDIRLAPGEALRLLGVVFQSRTLDLDLSVTQNLLYHAAMHGIARREARLRSDRNRRRRKYWAAAFARSLERRRKPHPSHAFIRGLPANLARIRGARQD